MPQQFTGSNLVTKASQYKLATPNQEKPKVGRVSLSQIRYTDYHVDFVDILDGTSVAN